MVKLIEIFDKNPYQSNLDGHKEEDLRGALDRLESLTPGTSEYWKLKAEVLSCIARNAMEQFSRDKYDAGMMSQDLYKELFWELESREEKSGLEWEFF